MCFDKGISDFSLVTTRETESKGAGMMKMRTLSFAERDRLNFGAQSDCSKFATDAFGLGTQCTPF